ncbi:hypothetical protein NPIL_9971 [Nephila pilipes]|uniref:Uncharacterized protein n=1 Tax=Nephila pilipes TaxID=299642 RepID=A0A8X6QSN6_NEPPI|nr:hypothetical protein NPIL_9971 [Nephila pilipes]
MDAGEITPMPSPTKSPKRNPRPTTTNSNIPRRQMAPPITVDNVRNGATLLKALQDLTKRVRSQVYTTPVHSLTSTPLQEPQNTPDPTITTEEFPPLPSKPENRKKQPKTTETTLEDPFSKSEKCLYKEMQQFDRIANNIPTKAGRMAALFKFIEEEN